MKQFNNSILLEKIKNSDYYLPVILGKTKEGNVYISDLRQMPHLLVVASNYQEKKAFLHLIIESLLFKSSDKNIRFIFIDSKKSELSTYSEISNLQFPIIQTEEKAIETLKWSVSEIEHRFTLFLQNKVRDIVHYNKIAEKNKKISYIVIIIAELSDVMTKTKEIESFIALLAWKARVAGIHLVISTQNTSQDIITPLILANLPAKVVFKLNSIDDSKRILGQIGAESLSGNGEMLFLNSGCSNPIKIYSF